MSGHPGYHRADRTFLESRGWCISLEGSQKESVEELKTSSYKESKKQRLLLLGADIPQTFTQAVQPVTLHLQEYAVQKTLCKALLGT